MPNRCSFVLCAILFAVGFSAASPSLALAQDAIHVATDGRDTDSGTATAPLRTLKAALALARGGEVIRLGPGDYPQATDVKAREETVEVVGASAAETRIAGLQIHGGQEVSLRGVTFTAAVTVHGKMWAPETQAGRGITIADSEFRHRGNCVTLKANARDIRLSSNRFSGCSIAIAGPSNPVASSDIVIEDNVIEDSTADGIQFGSWDRVRISGNRIHRIYDPAKKQHNDAIQLTGRSRGVEISRNELRESRTQLLFIQDALGPIDDLLVSDNVLSGAGAVALQSLGATRAQFVHNTIWNAKDGGLWLRAGTGGRVVPADTVLLGNLAQSIKLVDGAAVTTAAENIVRCFPRGWTVVLAPGTTCVTSPGFLDELGHELKLLPESIPYQLAGTGTPAGARL